METAMDLTGWGRFFRNGAALKDACVRFDSFRISGCQAGVGEIMIPPLNDKGLRC